MNGQIDLSRFAKELHETDKLEQLWRATVELYRSFGFGGVGYVVFKRGRTGDVAVLLADGFPDIIVQTFADEGYGRNDPNFRYVLATGLPVLRSRTIERTTISRAEQRLRSAFDKLDLGETLTLPLFGPHNYTGVLVLGRANSSDIFDERHWPELHTAAVAAHLRCFAAQSVRLPLATKLSQRELEILEWVGQGKSNGVIAEILAITPSTVDTYMRRLFAKLGVADRTAAAVRGVAEGLIRV